MFRFVFRQPGLLVNHVGFDVLDGLLELSEGGLDTFVAELVRVVVAQPERFVPHRRNDKRFQVARIAHIETAKRQKAGK